MKTSL